MSRRIWTRTSALAAVLLIAGIAACGIPTDDRPQALSPDEIPDQLDAPTTQPTGGINPDEPGSGFTVELYWFERGFLVPRTRLVVDLNKATVLRALLQGVSEQDGGVQTSIPSGTAIRQGGVRTTEDGVLIVDLTDEITTIEGEELKRALAQIVFTVTDLEDREVQFEVEGDSLAAITDAGTEDGPVTRSDFLSLRVAETTTTVTTTTVTE